MFISEAFAQTAGGPGLGGLAGIEQFLPFVLIFVVFYFLLIRPQQKKLKQHKELVAGLRRGDRVVTQSGIFGTISKVIDDASVLVEIAEGVRVRFARETIGQVLAKTEPATAVAKDEPADKAGDEAKK